ncbi:MAG: restriction endonuclease subunit S [Bacteroidales bacterium]|nr:restriction endonuclease subunit S [Bacteroidales bacterium]
MKKDWKYIPLKEVCAVQNGFAFDSKLFGTSGCPLIRIRDIKRGYSETYTSESVDDSYLVNNGDILIGMDGDFNIAEWNGGKAFLNQRVCKLIPSNNLLSRYALYFLPKELNSINSKTTFSTVKHLSSKQVLAISIPVPPLPEQQQIVDYLDSAFAKIDQLKANAEKQLQDAQSLFSAALEEAMSPKEGWVKKTLGEICSKIGSGATPKGGKKVYIEKGVSLVRSMNVRYGFFDYTELAHINDEAASKLNGVTLNKDDILFNITGASIARCCVLPEDVLPARVNQHVCILRIKEGAIPQFLCYCLISKNHQKELLVIGEAASTRQALTKNDMEKHIISFPNKQAQQSIVSHLDALSAKVNQLKENYKLILTECDALKQALLREVFE